MLPFIWEVLFLLIDGQMWIKTEIGHIMKCSIYKQIGPNTNALFQIRLSLTTTWNGGSSPPFRAKISLFSCNLWKKWSNSRLASRSGKSDMGVLIKDDAHLFTQLLWLRDLTLSSKSLFTPRMCIHTRNLLSALDGASSSNWGWFYAQQWLGAKSPCPSIRKHHSFFIFEANS